MSLKYDIISIYIVHMHKRRNRSETARGPKVESGDGVWGGTARPSLAAKGAGGTESSPIGIRSGAPVMHIWR